MEPAFPGFDYIDQYGKKNPQGMTLRDYFAAKAMQALLTCGKYNGVVGVNNYEINRAKDAYAVADAMMEARNVAQ